MVFESYSTSSLYLMILDYLTSTTRTPYLAESDAMLFLQKWSPPPTQMQRLKSKGDQENTGKGRVHTYVSVSFFTDSR